MYLAIFSFLIGVGLLLFFAYPRILIYRDKSSDSHDPFRTPFAVKNIGYLPVLDVNYSLTIDQIVGGNLDKFTSAPMSITNRIPRLDPNEKSVIFSNRIIVIDTPPDLIKHVEIHVRASYRPYLLPFTVKKSVHFNGKLTTIGDFVWFEDTN